VDIPDALYRQLTVKAAREKRSIEELILQSVETGLHLRQTKTGRRVTLPIIRSKHPGCVRIDDAKIYEIIPFP
jgi:hypothetical protein